MEKKSGKNIYTPGLSVYLGLEPERSRRLVRLQGMAKSLNVTVSEMFRMLADGKLDLVVGRPVETAPAERGD